MSCILIIIVFCATIAFGIPAGKYFFDRHRYLGQAKQFARRNGLNIEGISVAGLDVALSGRLDGRSIKTSIVRMSIDEDSIKGVVTPDVVECYFESYHIEVNIDKNQQWLVLMNFEHQGKERIQSPEMPRYRNKFSTVSKEFDRKYFLCAESRPSHHLFGKPELLRELMAGKLRAAHANNGALHVYFERPMLWKYSSFCKVENLIRLAMKIA